jgi:hypothetical protein
VTDEAKAYPGGKDFHFGSNGEKIFSPSENFTILRSIVDTAIKDNQNVLQALDGIADYERN